MGERERCTFSASSLWSCHCDRNSTLESGRELIANSCVLLLLWLFLKLRDCTLQQEKESRNLGDWLFLFLFFPPSQNPASCYEFLPILLWVSVTMISLTTATNDRDAGRPFKSVIQVTTYQTFITCKICCVCDSTYCSSPSVRALAFGDAVMSFVETRAILSI